jgi:hypothetical protein
MGYSFRFCSAAGVDAVATDWEAMTAVCREFGTSRKTDHKLFERYKEHRLELPLMPSRTRQVRVSRRRVHRNSRIRDCAHERQFELRVS